MHSQEEIKDVLVSISDAEREYTRIPAEEAQKLADLINRYEYVCCWFWFSANRMPERF